MVTEKIGDIFEQEDLNVIIHQANCFCTMGSGIATSIRQKYPEACRADLETKKGDFEKLGDISYATSTVDDKTVINVYGQYEFGGYERNTNNVALAKGLDKVRQYIASNPKLKVGIPYLIGCGLAGGDWNIVKELINDAFKGLENQIVICKLPEYA